MSVHADALALRSCARFGTEPGFPSCLNCNTLLPDLSRETASFGTLEEKLGVEPRCRISATITFPRCAIKPLWHFSLNTNKRFDRTIKSECLCGLAMIFENSVQTTENGGSCRDRTCVPVARLAGFRGQCITTLPSFQKYWRRMRRFELAVLVCQHARFQNGFLRPLGQSA